MKRGKIIISLLIILVVAAAFRFWKITTLHCMNWDEATFLFNAHSIATNLRDEYGVFLPFQFKSIGDYKFPLFIYMMAPLTKIIGTTVFTVRVIPATLGVVATLVIYKITELVTKNRLTAVISAAMLAISPWHLQFTRDGADVGVSTFFTLLGTYLLLRAIIKNKSYLPAALVFAVSLYTYFGERVFIPLFVTATFWFFKNKIIKNKKHFKKGLVFFFIALIPAGIIMLSSGDQNKFLNTTLFGYTRSQEYVQTLLTEDYRSKLLLNLFHSDISDKVLAVADHYLNHFSPSFLFTEGPPDGRQYILGMGMLYLFDLPLILMGLYKVLKGERSQKIILLWLLVAPIPAAITRDVVHARRAINMLYPLIILSATGLTELILIKNKKLRFTILSVFMGLLVYGVSFYILSYSIFTPLRTEVGSAGWQCGYKALIDYIESIKSGYDKVVIDTSYQGPYVYFLLYTNYPPEEYQKQAKLVRDNPQALGEGGGYANYVFRPIYWPNDRGEKNTLFAGPPERIPDHDIAPPNKLLKKLYFDDGEVSWVVVSTDLTK